MNEVARLENTVQPIIRDIKVKVGGGKCGKLNIYLPQPEFAKRRYGLSVDHVNELLVVFPDENGPLSTPQVDNANCVVPFPRIKWHTFDKRVLGDMICQDLDAKAHPNGTIEIPFPDWDKMYASRNNPTKEKPVKQDNEQPEQRAVVIDEQASQNRVSRGELRDAVAESRQIKKSFHYTNIHIKRHNLKVLIKVDGTLCYERTEIIDPESA